MMMIFFFFRFQNVVAQKIVVPFDVYMYVSHKSLMISGVRVIQFGSAAQISRANDKI